MRRHPAALLRWTSLSRSNPLIFSAVFLCGAKRPPKFFVFRLCCCNDAFRYQIIEGMAWLKEQPLSIAVGTEQTCSTPNCAGKGVQTTSVGRIDQPDPNMRQYSYSGFCPVCHGTRAGSFFLRGDDMTVETALIAAESAS